MNSLTYAIQFDETPMNILMVELQFLRQIVLLLLWKSGSTTPHGSTKTTPTVVDTVATTVEPTAGHTKIIGRPPPEYWYLLYYS